MKYTTQNQAARAAHILSARREAEALRRRASHALRMGDERAANKWARKARQYETRADVWES